MDGDKRYGFRVVGRGAAQTTQEDFFIISSNPVIGQVSLSRSNLNLYESSIRLQIIAGPGHRFKK